MGEIDFTRFIKRQETIIPIVEGWGSFHGRKITANVDNGWFQIELADTYRVVRKATLLEISQTISGRKTLSGYCYGDEIIPINFQNLFARGFGETVKVWFLNQEPWNAVKCVQWEDGRFYYVDVDFAYHSRLAHLRELFETEQTLLNEKDLSPEIRYMWLLMSLERDTWRHLQELEALKLSEREKKKRAEEFKLNFAERIKQAIIETGSKFISATRQSDQRYLVVWKTGRQIVHSLISDKLRVISGGFCLSQEDAKHSIRSLSMLAQEYQKEKPLYITRT